MSTVGDSEHKAVAYCTKPHGTRPFPNGSIKGEDFIVTDAYVQMTGTANLTKINVPIGDSGGELDNRGAEGVGNPCKEPIQLNDPKLILGALSGWSRLLQCPWKHSTVPRMDLVHLRP